ncbi:MAG: sulfate transporter CysZ [Gammaproteobacteria bacterium]|nr:sulfate transporter CysZ [Gammaproteobacteria bacterium]
MFDFNYVLRGFSMIMKPGLKRYVIIPLLISVIVFSLAGWIGYIQFENFINSMLPEDSWMQWLSWILWPVFFLTFLFLIFYGYTIIANLIAAPFNSKLAEAVARKLDSDAAFPESEPLIKDVAKSIFSELRKLLYYLIRALPLLLLMLFPLTSAVASIVWLMFSAWFLALEYAAYPLENQKLLFKEQRQTLGKNKLSAMSFGAGVTLLLLIPVLNLAVMPAAVAGATIYWHEKLKN